MDHFRKLNEFLEVYIGEHPNFEKLEKSRYWCYIHSPVFQELFKATYGVSVQEVVQFEIDAGRIPPPPKPRLFAAKTIHVIDPNGTATSLYRGGRITAPSVPAGQVIYGKEGIPSLRELCKTELYGHIYELADEVAKVTFLNK